MKLCVDCIHAKMPNPLACWNYGQAVLFPICQHPSAVRDVVYGNCIEKCETARMGPNCGPDAKLFEPRLPQEPTPTLRPYQLVEVAPPLPVNRDSRPFWRRIFGG